MYLRSTPDSNKCVAKECLLCRALHNRHYVESLIMVSHFIRSTNKVI